MRIQFWHTNYLATMLLDIKININVVRNNNTVFDYKSGAGSINIVKSLSDLGISMNNSFFIRLKSLHSDR